VANGVREIVPKRTEGHWGGEKGMQGKDRAQAFVWFTAVYGGDSRGDEVKEEKKGSIWR